MKALTRRTIEGMVHAYIRVHGINIGSGDISYDDFLEWMKYHKDLSVFSDLPSAQFLYIYPGTKGYVLKLEAAGIGNYTDGAVLCKINKLVTCPFADFKRLSSYSVYGAPDNCFIDYEETSTDYVFRLRGDWASHPDIGLTAPPLIVIGG